MKISPVFEGFLNYLKGSPAQAQAQSEFFRYDGETTEEDVVGELSGAVGFCYVLQFNQMSSDTMMSALVGTTRYDMTLLCYHSALSTAVFKPLESAEIFADLNGGDFTSTDGALIQVFTASPSVELILDEGVICHAVNFTLIRNTNS